MSLKWASGANEGQGTDFLKINERRDAHLGKYSILGRHSWVMMSIYTVFADIVQEALL